MQNERIHFRQLGVRRQFQIIFLLLILLPTILFSLVLNSIFSSMIEDRIQTQEMLTLQSITDTVVNRHIEDMEKALSALSKEEALINIFSDQSSADFIYRQWEFCLEIFPERSWIYYGNKDNQIFVRPDWEAGPDYDLRIRPWYTAAKDSEGIVWTDPYLEYLTSDVVLSAAIAIYDNNGIFQGVLGIDTYIKSFMKLLSEASKVKGKTYFFVTNDGQAIDLNGQDEAILDVEKYNDGEKFTGMDDETGYYTIREQDYFYSSIYIPKLKAYLISLIPATVILQEKKTIFLTIGLIGLISFIWIIFGGYYFSRYLVNDLEHLSKYVESLKTGDFSIKTCVVGESEFLTLNKSINDMVRQLSMNIRELTQDSITDSLTGIANRRHLLTELGKWINQAVEDKNRFYMIIYDIDNAKTINNQYGHSTGDAVILRLSSLLTDYFDNNALVGRYSGEEFMVLIKDLKSLEDTFQLADDFRKSVSTLGWGENLLSITLSGGFVQYNAGESVELLVERCEQALFTAKREGKNKIVIA